ncbi:MAG: type II secretion system F family protein [Alcaligenaceae bacterium]|nr:type II secretion system F family protein [Alcaligenaceae bacterium]
MYFWLSCATAGLSLCLLAWIFMRPVAVYRKGRHAFGRASLLGLVWPWVAVLAAGCNPFISWRVRRLLEHRIVLAGLDPGWRAEDVVGLQCFCAAACAASAAALPQLLLEGPWRHGLPAGLLAGLLGAAWPWRRLAALGVRRQEHMLRELPFLLDVTTLCVEAGLNLHGALQQAARHGPEGPLRGELRHALSDMRAGMPRTEALAALAERTGLPAMRSLVTALNQADQMGMSLGPLLRAQSDQRRGERFLKAEKLALEAPVKMLFPMVFCIFPCTFLILAFPVALKLAEAGF